jgi:hypothetical protein
VHMLLKQRTLSESYPETPLGTVFEHRINVGMLSIKQVILGIASVYPFTGYNPLSPVTVLDPDSNITYNGIRTSTYGRRISQHPVCPRHKRRPSLFAPKALYPQLKQHNQRHLPGSCMSSAAYPPPRGPIHSPRQCLRGLFDSPHCTARRHRHDPK